MDVARQGVPDLNNEHTVRLILRERCAELPLSTYDALLDLDAWGDILDMHVERRECAKRGMPDGSRRPEGDESRWKRPRTQSMSLAAATAAARTKQLAKRPQ